MSTIKDTYGTLYTEAQIAAAEKLTFADFQPGVTYWVPEFVYQDIDGPKTKYYKLVERTISDLRLQADLVDFTSSKIGDLNGVAVKVVPVGKVVLFKLDGVNFNAGSTYNNPTIATNGGPYAVTNPYRLLTEIGVGSIGVYIKLERPASDAGDYTDYYTIPAGIVVNSAETIDTGGDGWDHTYRLNCTIVTDEDKEFNIESVVAEGNVITFKREGVNFDGEGVYDTGNEAGQFTPVTAGGTEATVNSIKYPAGVNPTIHFKLLFWGVDNTEDFDVDYNLPAGVTLVGEPVFNDTDFVWEFDAIIDTDITTDVNFTSNFATVNLQNNGVNFDGNPSNFGNPPTTGTGRINTVDHYVTYWTNNHSFKTLQGYPAVSINFNIGINSDELKNGSFDDAYNLPVGFVVDSAVNNADNFFVTGHFAPDAANKTLNFTWK